MGVVFDVLFFLSVVAIAILIIMFIVKVIFKKGPAFKKLSIAFASSIVVFIASGILMPELTPEQKAAIEEREREKELAAAAEAEKDTEQDTKDQEQQKESDPKETDQQTTEEKEKQDEVNQEEKVKESERPEEKERKRQEAENAYLNTIDDSTVEGKVEVLIYELMKSENTKPEDVVTDVTYNETSSIVDVTVPGSDNFSTSSIRKGFYTDAMKVFGAVANEGSLSEVETVAVNITFPMQDKYGNTEEKRVFRSMAETREVRKVDNPMYFELPENLPKISEGITLHPTFQE